MSTPQRLFVLGATGHIGGHLLTRALARGHAVTAFVRSPRKLAARAGLTVVAGDPCDRDALAAALPGHDAIVSSLGPRLGDAFRAGCTLMGDSAASVVAAAAQARTRRLLVVSSALLFPEEGLMFRFFRRLLGQHLRDLRTMEAVLTGSDLAWTVARPPRLVAGADASFRAVAGGLPERHRATTFDAVAAFLLDAVERDRFHRAVVGVSR